MIQASRWAALGLLAALIGVPGLMADEERGKGHGHGHGKGHERRAYGHEEGWERRGDFEYRTFGGDERPPGWNRGRKTGWGNCGMPPGQAKKYGCRGYVYQGQQYFYYQEDDGRIIVRRPTIAIHGSIDIVK